MKKIQYAMPHLLIIFSIMFLVFDILDYYNPTMKFLNSSISKYVLFAFIATALINAVMLIIKQRHENDR